MLCVCERESSWFIFITAVLIPFTWLRFGVWGSGFEVSEFSFVCERESERVDKLGPR